MLAMGGLGLGEAVTSSGLLLSITQHLQGLVSPAAACTGRGTPGLLRAASNAPWALCLRACALGSQHPQPACSHGLV